MPALQKVDGKNIKSFEGELFQVMHLPALISHLATFNVEVANGEKGVQIKI